MKKGAIELESAQNKFQFDKKKTTSTTTKSSSLPSAIETKRIQEANKAVEEWMILANGSVGEELYRNFPTCAMLRNHPNAKAQKFEDLIKLAASRGMQTI
jgi:exosome complex exonuclease DIS3/RRP44